MKPIHAFWFRRDLRLQDNRGLFEALEAGLPVLPVFIFDTEILSRLNNTKDARVEFILQSLKAINQTLNEYGYSMCIKHGKPEEVWETLSEEYPIEAIYCNEDYEPYATQRDLIIKDRMAKKSIAFRAFKDHVVFKPGEVLKDDGLPYTVFTPYAKKWRAAIKEDTFKRYHSEHIAGRMHIVNTPWMPELHDLGFEPSGLTFPKPSVASGLIKDYADKRNFPALDACSHLGVHFRFGTISIREKAGKALQLSDTWVNELIWRDFYIQIMAFFPHVVESAFKHEYNRIDWINNPEDFNRWCEGLTGYPLVDAGMRELNTTGYMHNRVRMVTASFLCKHLLIDWRWGEAYFAEKLLDFDLASNNGGWQWAAGSGVDAAPYFRIFNPALQTERFDPDHTYIKRWIPEYGTNHYPSPIVEHRFARERCLNTYKRALSPGG